MGADRFVGGGRARKLLTITYSHPGELTGGARRRTPALPRPARPASHSPDNFFGGRGRPDTERINRGDGRFLFWGCV